MFIGIQFSSETLGNLLRERFKRIPLCVPDQISVQGDVYVVDNITIDPQTTFGIGSTFVVQVPVAPGNALTPISSRPVAAAKSWLSRLPAASTATTSQMPLHRDSLHKPFARCVER